MMMKSWYLTHYDKDEELENAYEEGRMLGLAEAYSERHGEGSKEAFIAGFFHGRHEGLIVARKRTTRIMLTDGEPLARIIKYTKLEEDAILTIAKKLGISVTRQ